MKIDWASVWTVTWVVVATLGMMVIIMALKMGAFDSDCETIEECDDDELC